ncbi:hypothetical protein CEXT_645341 [Caerostris extrusa]|uniref:Uncharacterized protein n=1 Tax=Caerostris extrusa TaxID=172846 RepID=A0AAV4UQD9_CAEEX|nr:hypothetical protein CEXT_645341 [Caerostris extrusa]
MSKRRSLSAMALKRRLQTFQEKKRTKPKLNVLFFLLMVRINKKKNKKTQSISLPTFFLETEFVRQSKEYLKDEFLEEEKNEERKDGARRGIL